MTENNGQPEAKSNLPVEWQDERTFEVPLVRPVADPSPLAAPPLAARTDTTPPFRSP